MSAQTDQKFASNNTQQNQRNMEESGNVFDDMSPAPDVLLHNDQTLPSSSQLLDSLWIPNPSTSFQGCAAVVNFDKKTRARPLFPQSDQEENGNQEYEGYFHQPEKKRRLLPEQVKVLEKTFDVETKLEPERKIQLAKELGLQPRQVAIWFQNRRARSKTKQLEKDYDSLNANYDKLKADYDTLFKENEKLKNEIEWLTEKLFLKGKVKLEPCDTLTTLDSEPQKLIKTAIAENVSSEPIAVGKQEDASSARSGVFDSDSPRNTDGNYSSLLEPGDSSHVFEPDLSDFSQDEDNSLDRSLLCAPPILKLEDQSYNDLSANSCILDLPNEDQATWFWDC